MWVTALLVLLAGCADLGVIGDATSVSLGRPSRGVLVEGARMPDRGEGFVTPEPWRVRGNRYGTDELVDLLTGVARRLAPLQRERLSIADLSMRGGGPARTWHASHQSGRDVDLLYYVRDRAGNPVEPQEMRAFDATGRATDGSGDTVDVARMWLLARELITAPEAPVQWIFVYEPLAARIIAHAESVGEPAPLIAKVRLALRQPGRAAPHDDHVHVRIYCSAADKAYGCLDHGPMELMETRDDNPMFAAPGLRRGPPCVR
jgi:penicillin-insensitive murein DD-endopeptidase